MPDPDNREAWELFCAAATQWRRAGMEGIPTGLDYAAVDALRRAFGIRAGRDLWERIRVLEAEALRVMTKRIQEEPPHG
ncbi:DUF1799 domain-containing protein [Deferrisoma camini]|uniref:DUF1799 domain-containing protein n=1 Tax=Deferrisoma camini TaxID=1035120 RepID=UPI00046CF82D|nr:DUF1799 domain-containing protein [Deferrisoma camini]